jgi:hypothetical protein
MVGMEKPKEVEKYQGTSRNESGELAEGRERSRKKIDEVGRMARSRKQNKDRVKSKKFEDGTGNLGRGRGRWTAGSRNVEADAESLRSLDIARGTSAEGARRSRDLECRRRQRGGRRDADHLAH